MTYFSLSFVAAALLAIACDKSGDGLVQTESDLVPVIISEANLNGGTKAMRLDSTTCENFGLFAGHVKTGVFGETSPGANYMRNARVNKDFTSKQWSTAVKYYWPKKGNGTVSFFPYAPYIGDESILKLSPSYISGEPVLLYSPDTLSNRQVDFCLAPPLYDKTSDDNPLSVNFSHALTFIQFYANYKTGERGLPSGIYIKIDRISLCNVIGTKEIVWKSTDPYFEWQNDSDGNLADYTLTRSEEQLTDSQIDTTYQRMEYERGRLFLLPQTINEPGQSVKSTLDIGFSFFRMNGSNEMLISSFNVVNELPAGTVWSPCSVIRYYFTINIENLSEVEITSSTSDWITDWESSGNTDPNQTFEK